MFEMTHKEETVIGFWSTKFHTWSIKAGKALRKRVIMLMYLLELFFFIHSIITQDASVPGLLPPVGDAERMRYGVHISESVGLNVKET